MQLNGQNPNPGTLLPWQQGHDKLCEFHGRLHVCKRVYPLYKPTRAVGTGSVNYSIDHQGARMTASDRMRKLRARRLLPGSHMRGAQTVILGRHVGRDLDRPLGS